MTWPSKHAHCVPLSRRLVPPETPQAAAKRSVERKAGEVFRCLAWEGDDSEAPFVREGWTLERAAEFSLTAATIYGVKRGQAPLSPEDKVRRKVDRMLLGWSPKVRKAFREG